MKRAARYIIFYSALFGLWTLLAELKIWPPYLFPTPWGVGESLYAGFQDHSYWIAIRVSMQRVLIGYGISVILGMILGLGVASNKFLEETMGGLLVSLQSSIRCYPAENQDRSGARRDSAGWGYLAWITSYRGFPDSGCSSRPAYSFLGPVRRSAKRAETRADRPPPTPR